MSTEQNPFKPATSSEVTTPLTPPTSSIQDGSETPQTLYQLGIRYFKGAEDTPKDFKRAAEYMKKAANLGLANAQFQISEFYWRGIGVNKDVEQRAACLLKAAKQNHYFAQTKLSICYFNGIGVSKDEELGFFWLKKAASKEKNAQHELGLCYTEGRGVPRDTMLAVQEFKKAAQQNYAPSQHILGRFSFHGTEVTKDEKLAAALFQRAAAQNFSPAQADLGMCYINGIGVAPDEEQAIYLLKQAVANKDPHGQYGLGTCHLLGKGVEKDPKQAIALLEAAVAQNSRLAKYELGMCYFRGEGVAQDIPKTLKLLEEAAHPNVPQAYYCLGIYYLKAFGAAKDPKRGVELLTQAAQKKYAPALYALGMCLLNGEGLSTTDPRRGIEYFTLASQSRSSNNLYINTSPLDPSEAEAALSRFDDPAEIADEKQDRSPQGKIEILKWAIASVAYLCTTKDSVTKNDFTELALTSPLNPYAVLKDPFFKKALKKMRRELSSDRAKFLQDQINSHKDIPDLEHSLKSQLLVIFQDPENAKKCTIAMPEELTTPTIAPSLSDISDRNIFYKWFKSSVVKHAARIYPSATETEKHFEAAQLTFKGSATTKLPFFIHAALQKDFNSVLYIYKKTTKEQFHELVRMSASFGPPYDALYIAAHADCEKFVALFLTVLTPEEATNPDASRGTPLQFAIEHNSHKVVAVYVQRYGHQPDVLLKTHNERDGNNSLHLAIKNGNLIAFKLLLSVFSSPHLRAKNNYGENALELALKLGQYVMAKLLLDKMTSEDLGEVNAAGATKFYELVSLPHTPKDAESANKYKLLLEIIVKKSTLHLNTAETRHGFTPLHASIQNGNAYLTQLLLAQPDIELNAKTKDQNRFTPLHFAAHHGNMDAVKTLLTKEGLNINAKASSDRTPMHCALSSGQIISEQDRLQLVELLLTHNADIASKSTKGFTPLHLAAAHKHTECAQLLLIHMNNQQANESSHEGGTALHLAVATKNTALVEVLLGSKKMDVNATYKGQSSLHGAAAMGNLEIVTMLLDCKADPLAKDTADHTPLQLALIGKMTKQRQQVIALLKKYQPDILTSPATATDSSSESSTSTTQSVTKKLRKAKKSSFLSAWDELLSQCADEGNAPTKEDVHHRDLRDSHLLRAERYAPKDFKLIPATASTRAEKSKKLEEKHYYLFTRHTMTSDNPVFIHVTDDVITGIGDLWPLVENRLKSDPHFLDASSKKQGIKPIVKSGGFHELSLRGHAEGIGDLRLCGKFQECTDVPGYEGQKVLVLKFDRLLTHTEVERLSATAPSGPATMFASSAAAPAASVPSSVAPPASSASAEAFHYASPPQ